MVSISLFMLNVKILVVQRTEIKANHTKKPLKRYTSYYHLLKFIWLVAYNWFKEHEIQLQDFIESVRQNIIVYDFSAVNTDQINPDFETK